MRRLFRGLLIVAMTVMLALVSASASAQDDPLDSLTDEQFNQVVELLGDATDAEEASQWRLALGFFEEVSNIVALPEVRIREARAHEQLGNIQQAVVIYRAVVSAGGQYSREADEALDALRTSHPPVLVLSLDGVPADLSIDGEIVDRLRPGTHRIALTPGEHELRLLARGTDAVVLDVTMEIGDQQERYVRLSDVAAGARERPPRNGQRLILPVATTLMTAGALGAAIGLQLSAQSQRDQHDSTLDTIEELVREAPNRSNGAEIALLNDFATTYDSRRRTAGIMYGAAGAMAAVSVVSWWWALQPVDSDETSVHLTPQLGGAQLHIQW
ncbi:MAG: hypothetical protein ACI81R_003791 [Bradymonadia bacterium]|jgi:hypothetical protein